MGSSDHFVEEPLTLVQQAAYRANRMEALGALTAGVAHDFTTVLQIVGSTAELIRDSLDDRATVERLALMLEKVAKRGGSLINRLMFIARVDAAHAEPLDIAHVLRGVSQILVHTLSSNITIEVDAPDGLPQVRVDRAELETALLNIAVNSRQAMPQGGHFTLRARLAQDADHTEGQAVMLGRQYVQIEAVDNGIGMSPGTLARAKERFFTTKPPGEGTGLGLAMADELAKRFGGHFSIESQLHRGTTVCLSLPADVGISQEGGGDAGDTITSKPILQKLVLLDDVEMLRKVLARQMRREGLEVTAVDSAAELFQLLRSEHQIDALVTDYHMPDITGERLIGQVRDLRPGLPVAVLTGSLPNAGQLTALWDNLVVIAKPAGARHIINCIEMMLRHRSVNEMAGRYVDDVL